MVITANSLNRELATHDSIMKDILDLLDDKQFAMNVTDISRFLHFERRVLYLFLNRLKHLDLVEENKLGGSKLYTIKKHETVYKPEHDVMIYEANGSDVLWYEKQNNGDYLPIFAKTDNIIKERNEEISFILQQLTDDFGLNEFGIIKDITTCVDLESTGFVRNVYKWGDQLIDKLTQCGFGFLDEVTGEIAKIIYFNINDGITDIYKYSYPFVNIGIDFNQLTNLGYNYSLNSYRNLIQDILNKTKITSYNKLFDLYFLEAKNFLVNYEAPDIMLKTRGFLKRINREISQEDLKIKCNLASAWEYFFDEKISNHHHAGDDCNNELLICGELSEVGFWSNEIFPSIKRMNRNSQKKKNKKNTKTDLINSIMEKILNYKRKTYRIQKRTDEIANILKITEERAKEKDLWKICCERQNNNKKLIEYNNQIKRLKQDLAKIKAL